MNPPAPVVGCSACGALYPSDPEDQGVCARCRMSLPLPPTRAPAPEEFAPEPEVAEPETPARRSARSGAPRASRRGLRGLATGAVIALLVGGLVGSTALGWRAPAEAWNGIRRQSSGAWASVRGHSFTDAWVSLRKHAWDAWLAIRRHTPLDQPDAEASVAAKTTGEGTTIARGTHRRTKGHSGKRRGD